jgi:hypothetical protein
MKNKFYFISSFVSLLTLAALMGGSTGVSAVQTFQYADDIGNQHYYRHGIEKYNQPPSLIDKIDRNSFAHICAYLPLEDLSHLRGLSKTMNEKVKAYDDLYVNPLIHQLTTFTPDETSGDLLKDALFRSEGDPGFRTHLIGLLKKKIEENGFLLDRRGLGLSSLLGHLLKRVSFHEFIREDARADSLFQAFFDCALPEEGEDRERSINQLAACFPVDALYFSEDAAKNVTLLNDFYEKNEQCMLDAIQGLRNQCPYFSYGVSDSKMLTDKVAHKIVVNQSQLKDDGLNNLLKENHPHTVIVAIDHAEGGVLSLSIDDLSQKIGKLSLVDPKQICTSIGDNFLSGFGSLTSLDTSGMSNVQSIGKLFLRECVSLTSLDTSGLKNVTSIGDGILYKCINLTSLDTRSLMKLRSIGDGFLYGCTSLISFDTRGLKNVKSIGKHFLSSCIGLTSLDTSGLKSVTSIGDNFLNECVKLTSLDTSGMSNVTSIGDHFLSDCKKLISLDTRGLKNVTSIRDNFLYSCYSLTSLDTSGLKNVTSIGDNFLNECVKLTSLDTSGMSNVTSIGDNFLNSCKNLTSLDTSGLMNVTSIGDLFLYCCASLTSLNTNGLINAKSIGYGFLQGCVSLKPRVMK